MKTIKPFKAFSKIDAVFLIVCIFSLRFLDSAVVNGEFHYKNIHITEAANFFVFWSIFIFVIIGIIAMVYSIIFLDAEEKLKKDKK